MTDNSRSSRQTVDPFLREIGARVREQRTLRRLSRRVLSERSGVSQRFIAELEGGRGNISIVRLKAIADALPMPLDQLVRPVPTIEPPPPRPPLDLSDGALANVLRSVPPHEQREMMEVLIAAMATEPR
ncbi:helix-turn-helix domain-containing protein [Acuticoccus sp. 2012]|uniref:Helix-turn-helix domain-containing protein n=2 Tax=Acuticoccus mangrovi TaxID=2796142 RepID=A0A934IMF0_9HYPH|nr:helix-turn-helix domain-containing protein [Acuticoccus mangrovi]MBJ3775058.1 helix-turn-helix domain-containing protein [Acuticoccus mangrovi]